MDILHHELTDRIINAFYDVYNHLGYGFLEKVYERALCLELTGSQQKKQAILGEFAVMMREAGWVDAVEDRCRVIPAAHGSRTIAARMGAAGYNQSY